MSDPSVVWYGPHACDACGATIVRAALEQGGAKFNPPARLLRAYQRGSEAGDVELVYPQRWTPHVCDPTDTDTSRPSETADPPTDVR